MSGQPARGYTWPPFAPGHTLTLAHGARSPRTVQPLADRYAGALAESAPWTAAPAFAGAVASWAWGEAQAALLRAWLDEHALLDDDGRERPAAEQLAKVEGRLVKLRDALGLTPRALGQLLASAASVASTTADVEGLDALRATGRRLLAARPDPGDAGEVAASG